VKNFQLKIAADGPGRVAAAILNEVAVNIEQTTHDEQQPWMASSAVEGKFCFAGCND
jgi:hypothetical protein